MRLGLRLFTVMLVAVSCLSAVAGFAAEMLPAPLPSEPVSAAPAALETFLRDSLFPLLGALLMGVITPLIYRVAAKLKLDSLMQKNNWLERAAFQGIALAEERAAQLAGSKLAISGNQKLDVAIAHVLGVMPKVSAEQADAMVHALLAQIPSLGASGEKAVASPGRAAAAPAINFLPSEALLFDSAPLPAAPPAADR